MSREEFSDKEKELAKLKIFNNHILGNMIYQNLCLNMCAKINKKLMQINHVIN